MPAEHVVVITGAGISAESGVQTYRDGERSWRDPAIERLSHASVYGNHLERLWRDHWGLLRVITGAAVPNAAHLAITAAQDRLERTGGSLTLATQNIDGLHTRALTRNVLELHGNVHRTRCVKKNHGVWWAPPHRAEDVPRCRECDRIARPDVVLFGELLDARTCRALDRALQRADTVYYVGTSGTVHPVASLPTYSARRVLLNADAWGDFDETVIGPATRVVPRMIR